MSGSRARDRARRPWRPGPRFAAAIAAAACAVAFLSFRLLRSRGDVAYVPTLAAPADYAPAAVALPAHIRIVDVTDDAGLRFRHSNGARGQRLLPETMGSGCAFVDFDRDGDQDIVLVNSCPWPGDAAGPPPTQALYENDGTGRFRDVTRDLGLAATFYGMGVAVGDYDGDGWDDLFFTAVGGDRLFRNEEGGLFAETTREAGIPFEGPYVWSTSAAFLDFDLDGDLDLFVCRYVEWSPEIDLAQGFQITGLGRAYGPPQNFAGAFSRLYRNDGGRFADVSAAAGIEVRNPFTGMPMGKALGVAVYDFDEDGRPDIAVANDTVQNFLFRNLGDGSFAEIGVEAGFAFDPMGSTRGAMGIDCADEDRAGSKAIAVGNFANEVTALYRSPDPSLIPFRDDAVAEGIGNPSRKYMKFGIFFFDLDLDGRLDLFESNGHLEHEIATVQAEQTYEQPPQVFWKAPIGSLRAYEVLGPEHLGPDLFAHMVGRGCAYADVDGDGDLDILCSPNGGRARLFRNDGGDRNGWIRLKLVGTRANRNAFGARVVAAVGRRSLRAQLQSGRSYLSQCEQVITLGLGSEPEAREVRVYWPGDPSPTVLGPIAARTHLVVRQPRRSARSRTCSGRRGRR